MKRRRIQQSPFCASGTTTNTLQATCQARLLAMLRTLPPAILEPLLLTSRQEYIEDCAVTLAEEIAGLGLAPHVETEINAALHRVYERHRG
jgi:hypothetical protein